MVASLYYKGKKVEKTNYQLITNLLKTDPAESITIRTYNETGAFLLRSPYGRRTINIEEDLDDRDRLVFAQEQIIYPYNSDFRACLMITINSFILEFQTLITPDLDYDDEYFNDIPGHISQILQYIHLVSLTRLFTDAEIERFLHQLWEQCKRLSQLFIKEGNTVLEEFTLDTLQKAFFNKDYMEDERLNYIAFN